MVADRKTPKTSVGIVSLIVVLTVLCLTVFCILALSTAKNEKNLSEKTAQAIQAYYAAEADCAETANEIGELWQKGGDKETFLQYADKNDVDCQIEENVVYFSYQRPIDEEQAFFATIRLDETFTITKWQVEFVGDWKPDTSLPVWDGGSVE